MVFLPNLSSSISTVNEFKNRLQCSDVNGRGPDNLDPSIV
jgi:hypothetical protein